MIMRKLHNFWIYFAAFSTNFILLTNGEPQAIGSCNFEETSVKTGNNLCGYTHGAIENDDFFNWELESDGGGHYMNVKTEEHFVGQRARLYSMEIDHEGTHCYTFQYHMEGWNTGNMTADDDYNSLNVYITDTDTHDLLLSPPVWQSTPNEYGSGWTTVQLALSPKVYRVVFEADIQDISPGIIALDNIVVNTEACENAPHFLRVTNKEVNENQDVTLNCLLWGKNLKLSENFRNQTPTIEMQRSNGDSFQPISKTKYNDHLSFSFKFTKLTKDTEGEYRCVSKNVTSVGVSNFAKISVKIPPVPQRPPDVIDLGSTHLKIRLNGESYVGDDPVIQTILNYRPLNGSWSDVHEIDGTEYHLWHLMPDTNYDLSVTLVRPGTGGAGIPGPALHQRTKCGVPLRPVEKVNLRPIASSEIEVSWKYPDFSVTQCHYHSYIIRYRKYNTTDEFQKKEIAGDVSAGLVEGLTPYTVYEIMIELVNSEGSMGTGPYTAQTGEGNPGPVPKDSFVVTETTETTISLRWEEPEVINGVLQKYEVEVNAISSLQPDFKPQSSQPDLYQVKATEHNLTVDKLNPGTTYTIVISALTSKGEGPGTSVSASTKISAPKMPVYPSPTPDNGSSSTPTTIEIEIKPAEAYGAPISNYYIVIEEIPDSSAGEPTSDEQSMPRTRNGKSRSGRRRKNGKRRQKRQTVVSTGDANSACHSKPISFEESKRQNKTFYFGGKLEPESITEGTKFVVGGGSDSNGFSNPPLDPNKKYNIYVRVESKIGNETRVNCALVAVKASVPPTTTTPTTTTLPPVVSVSEVVKTDPEVKTITPDEPNPDPQTAMITWASVAAGVGLLIIIVIIVLLYVVRKRRKKSNHNNEVVNPFEVRMMMTDVPATANGHSIPRSGTGDRQALMMPDVVDFENHDFMEKTLDASGTHTGTFRSGSTPLVEERPALRVDDFHIHVNEMNRQNKYGFHEEFTSFREGQTSSWDVGKREENRTKNRYGNIMAYDHSRVALQPIKSQDDQITTDYINASYVHGYKSPSMYIAAQAPLPDTVDDFWLMIWQEKSPVIVMVTNLVEIGKKKCHKYWPEETAQYGSIKVSQTHVEELCDYTIRTFVIQQYDGYDAREVKQFHFTAWPDHGVPTRPTNILSFIRRVKSYEMPGQGPSTIHCSAGSGRTGCFIVIDMMLDMARDEGVIDIYNTVTDLRSRRVNMVQTEEQYIFIHEAVLEALLCGDTLVAASDLRQHYDDLITVDQQTQIAPVQEEFETLNVMTPKLKDEECEVARLPRNRERNRYMDVLPSDRLMPYLVTPHPTDPDSNYINAIFTDSYAKRNAFIVTQTPLPNTVIDFWRLVYDYNCTSVIMMDDLGGQEPTCCQYWPDNGTAVFGSFTVELSQIEDEVDFTTRILKIQNMNRPNEAPRMVKQFQLTNWPENQPVPYTRNAVLRVIQLVTKWQTENNTPIASTKDEGRMLVHCLAGAGRSGTFVACYNMCMQLRQEFAVDVFNIVQRLRNIRPQLVETLEQYRFCYEVGWDFADQ